MSTDNYVAVVGNDIDISDDSPEQAIRAIADEAQRIREQGGLALRIEFNQTFDEDVRFRIVYQRPEDEDEKKRRLKKEAVQAEHDQAKLDPEYAEYQRLLAKFGGL